jgi:uncharacterized protein YegP (UPF0339 family)
MATYKILKDNKLNYFWILKSDKNGKIICMSSESYDSKQGAKNSIEWTRNNANNAAEIDETYL